MAKSNKTVKVIKRAELAKLTGCNLETIRYYETIGIMPEPPRTINNYRAYAQEHVSRLKFIMRSRSLGFTLDEVRDLLALVDGGAHTCSEAKDLANGHLASVRDKIADLKRIERVLSTTVAQCKGGDVPHCPVIDALTGAA